MRSSNPASCSRSSSAGSIGQRLRPRDNGPDPVADLLDRQASDTVERPLGQLEGAPGIHAAGVEFLPAGEGGVDEAAAASRSSRASESAGTPTGAGTSRSRCKARPAGPAGLRRPARRPGRPGGRRSRRGRGSATRTRSPSRRTRNRGSPIVRSTSTAARTTAGASRVRSAPPRPSRGRRGSPRPAPGRSSPRPLPDEPGDVAPQLRDAGSFAQRSWNLPTTWPTRARVTFEEAGDIGLARPGFRSALRPRQHVGSSSSDLSARRLSILRQQPLGQQIDAQSSQDRGRSPFLDSSSTAAVPRMTPSAEPLAQDLDRRRDLPPRLVAHPAKPEQPPHRDGEQVFDGQDVGPVQRVGRPRAQAQLVDRRVEGRLASNSRRVGLVFVVRERAGLARCPRSSAATPAASPRRCRTARGRRAATPCGRTRSASPAGSRRTARRRW